ncbi:CD40 ligand [Xyrichtys novacula]|uniref:CD40 ligand n=1 Tax=Xyrichtys novacula TaxID=13765 RepID=A0AAV1FCT7_XYRNO|nr:CD40 ligand [Xyrichtys novacula]
MINTYQTSLAPPPVPPRQHGGSHQVLIPAPLPTKAYSKSLLHFLVGVVLLNLFLTTGGFIYLSFKMDEKSPTAQEKAFFVPPEKQIGLRPETPGKALAHLMLYEPPGMGKSIPGLLQWDIGHSDLRNISLFFKNKVVIQKSGKYYVYSKVTFSKVTSSKSDSGSLLTSRVMLKRKVDEEKAAMKAYCNLDTNSGSVSIPRMCTATQGEVIALEKGDKLSVWVEDLSLVDYEDGATSFGMYEL